MYNLQGGKISHKLCGTNNNYIVYCCKHIFTLLPQEIWRVYKSCCEQTSSRFIQYSTFCSYWRQLLPHVVIAKPRTDLCWQCQQHSTLVSNLKNKSLDEKSEVLHFHDNSFNYLFNSFKVYEVAQKHMNLVKQERAHYRQCCQTSSENLKSCFPVVPPPSCALPANSTDTTIHYSFDMAQQVTTTL